MAQPMAQGPVPNVYTPVIHASEHSNLIVLNDNCILTLDAILSISGIGKVLSHRGHELYTLYGPNGKPLCEFEGTGLMQRTVDQIDRLHREHAERYNELRSLRDGRAAKENYDRLQRQIDALWYLPGNPGAKEAENDFAARQEALDEVHEEAGTKDIK